MKHSTQVTVLINSWEYWEREQPKKRSRKKKDHTVEAMNARRKKAWSEEVSLGKGERNEGVWGVVTSVWKVWSLRRGCWDGLDPLCDGAEEQRVTTMEEKLELEETKWREWKWGCLKVLEECRKRGSNGEEACELARREFMAINLGQGNVSVLLHYSHNNDGNH